MSPETDESPSGPVFEGRLKAALIAVVFLHFVLALAYAFQTPYRAQGRYFTNGGAIIPDIGAPDEREHANYILWLLDGNGLPVLNPKDPKLGEHYEFHQPPAYYLYEAGVAELARPFGIGIDSLSGGRLLRAGTAAIGALNILGIFFLAYWGFERADVGLAAACFAALLPMNLALSGAISNDPMLYCCCTWCLAFTAKALRSGWTIKRGVIVAVLVALACLTRTTGIALVPAVAIAAYCSGGRRPSARIATISAAVAFVIVLPWWLRNQIQYGDPFAIKAFNEAFVNSPTRNSLHWDWGRYITTDFTFTWRSFIGMFGYMDIPLPDVVARLTAATLLVFTLGAFLAIGNPKWKSARSSTVLNCIYIATVVVLFIGFNLKYFQGQARYLFPAIGSICVGFGLGLVYLSRNRWAIMLGACAAALLILNLWIVAQFLPTQFAMRLA